MLPFSRLRQKILIWKRLFPILRSASQLLYLLKLCSGLIKLSMTIKEGWLRKWRMTQKMDANSICLCSLPRRRFEGSSYFVSPHKRLLNRGQHSFPTLSQSRCTFQILESWPWPQGNPIITRSAWNFEKPSWPLINVSLRAAKVRFTQSDFRILRALHNLSEGKKRRKTVTLGSRSGSRFFTITSLWVMFSLSTLHLKTVEWSLTTQM